jgi:hypothetical protein
VRWRIDPVSTDVDLGLLHTGDTLAYIYTLTAEGTTHGFERGYDAFLGDPFGVDVVDGNLSASQSHLRPHPNRARRRSHCSGSPGSWCGAGARTEREAWTELAYRPQCTLSLPGTLGVVFLGSRPLHRRPRLVRSLSVGFSPTQTSVRSVVVRQNFSQGPKRAVLGRVGGNTMIDSVQQEDSGEGDARMRVERTYIHIYKGMAESRSELCRSIVTIVQHSESLL